MLVCKKLTFEHVASYQKGELDIQAHPFVVVTGLNRDSVISKKQNNGAGKSLLFSMIPKLLYEQTPLAKQKSRTKDGFISLELDIGQTSYTFTQKPKGYTILQDNEDLHVRPLAAQRQKIAELVPLTQEEWYSYVYLQSQKPSDFQHGSPVSRMAYLTSVWKLDDYDTMRRVIEKRLDDFKMEAAEVNVLNNQLTRLSEKLEHNGWTAADEERLARLDARIEKAEKVLARKQRAREQYSADMQQWKTKLSLKKRIEESAVPYDREQLKKLYKEAKAFEQYEGKLQDYKVGVKKIRTQIADLKKLNPDIVSSDLRELKEYIKTETKVVARMEKDQDTYEDLKRDLSNLDDHTDPDLRKFLSECNKLKVDPSQKIEKSIVQSNTLLEMESLLQHGGECPTCRQSIDVPTLKAQITSARKQKNRMVSFRRALYNRTEKKRLTEALDRLAFDEREFYARSKKLKNAVTKYETGQECMEARVRIEDLSARLTEMVEPAPVDQPEYTTDQLLDMDEKLASHNALLEQYERLKDVRKPSEVDAGDDSVYKKLFADKVKLTGRKTEFDMLNEQHTSLTEEISSHKDLQDQIRIHKALAKAYSPRGLKLYALRNVCLMLEQQYNRYRHLIFAEPFVFRVEAKDDGIHVLVERKNGPPTDVRELSGAESDSYRLLHFLTGLVLAQKDRRVNFAVLDEPDSHMDAATAQLFADQYIPFLRTVCPHIFLITQKYATIHEDCVTVCVEKHKGVSQLK